VTCNACKVTAERIRASVAVAWLTFSFQSSLLATESRTKTLHLNEFSDPSGKINVCYQMVARFAAPPALISFPITRFLDDKLVPHAQFGDHSKRRAVNGFFIPVWMLWCFTQKWCHTLRAASSSAAILRISQHFTLFNPEVYWLFHLANHDLNLDLLKLSIRFLERCFILVRHQDANARLGVETLNHVLTHGRR